MTRWLHFAIFLSMVTAIYGGVHFYVYTRTVAMLGIKPGGLLWGVRALFVFLVLSFFLSRMLLSWQHNLVTRTFYWGVCLWMGFFLYLLLFDLATHALSGVLHVSGLWSRLGQWLGLDPSRFFFALTLAGAAVVSGYAIYEARCEVAVTELEIPVKTSSSALDDFTIVQISDVHLGVIVDQHRMEQIVNQVNALHPDLVVITGDLMDENADRMLELADSIRQIKCPFGVFAVTGNHDYYAGAEQIIRHAAGLGVRYLTNEKVVLSNGLILYGINDPTAAEYGQESPPFEKIIGPEARQSPAVLFYHQPKQFEKAEALGVDLMLSGHTHKGQVWPMSHISRLIYPFQTGHYARGRSHLYVSRGIGTWGPPMRLDSRPEIVRIRLRAV